MGDGRRSSNQDLPLIDNFYLKYSRLGTLAKDEENKESIKTRFPRACSVPELCSQLSKLANMLNNMRHLIDLSETITTKQGITCLRVFLGRQGFHFPA